MLSERLMYEWLLPLFGFLIGIFAAITGVGGGVFFVPLLTLVFGFAPSAAIGTSLLVMVFGGLGATIGYARQKRVYFKAALLLALATAPGAILGAYLTTFLPSAILGIGFGVFIIILAIRMLFETKYFRRNKIGQTIAIACEAECFRHKKRLAICFGLSFFAGALSGLFGVGGGVLLVPILILVVLLPVHLAIGTSMFLVALTSLSGVFQHSLLGNVDFTLGLLLSVGAFLVLWLVLG